MGKGQDFPYSPKGKMGMSNFLIDTVLHSSRDAHANKLVFAKIDSLQLSELKIKDRLKTMIAQRCRSNDAAAHFLLYNPTGKDIKLKRLNEKLVAIEIARNASGKFQPVSLFMYPKCGTGIDYTDFVLKTGQILILKNTGPKPTGNFQTMAKLKLKASSNEILVSQEFPVFLDSNAFDVNAGLKNQIIANKWLLAFPDN